MGYLQDYNAKQGTTATGSAEVGYLQQYNSQPKTTKPTKVTKTPTVTPKKKKVSKDLTVSVVQPKTKVQQVLDTAKTRAKNLISNLTTKDISPVAEPTKPKTVQIKPGQKKIEKTQLKELFPDQPTAQASADFKTKLKPKIAKTSFNEMAGNVLSKIYEPTQYMVERDLTGKKRKLTGGQVVGGAIEDAMNSLIPTLGTSTVGVAKGSFNMGKQLVQGVKTGATLTAFHAVIKTMKDEAITTKDMLTSFGIGTLIGIWEPAPMTVAKGEIQIAKNTLREYGIKNYKSVTELKSKANKVFMKLHPDKGGDPAKFIEFNEAFNKVTSAGIDSSWKLSDITTWLKSLWRSTGKTDKQKALIKTKADNQFVKALKKVAESKPELKIAPGEKTPQQAIGEVIKTGKQNTPEGKEVVKQALEAQKTGQSVMIEKPEVAQAPINDLSVEAKKYKSAEEFVKAKQNVFHGTMEKGLKIEDKPIFLTKDFDEANTYAGYSYNQKPEGEVIGFHAKDGKSLNLNETKNTKKVFQDIYGSPKLKQIYDKIPERYEYIKENTWGEKELAVLSPKKYKEDFDDWVMMEYQSKPKMEGNLKVRTGSYGFGKETQGIRKQLLDAFNAYGIPTRQSVYANWDKIIKYAKEKGYDFIDHTTESPDTSILFPERVAISPKKSLMTKSQLTEIWNKANTPPPAKTKVGKSGGEVVTPKEKPVVKPKTVSVPREQLPVGEGKEKVSRLEARVKQSLENIDQDKIDELGLSTYKELNKKENISKAAEYVTKNPEEALEVLKGNVEAPKGILRNAIYVAMQNYSIGDVDLARKLASISSTRLGQEISILTEIDKDNPVSIMSGIVKFREKAFKEKYGRKSVDKVKNNVVKSIKDKIKKIDKYDWNAFINNIDTC